MLELRRSKNNAEMKPQRPIVFPFPFLENPNPLQDKYDESEDDKEEDSELEELDESEEKEFHQFDTTKDCQLTSVVIYQTNAAVITKRQIVAVKDCKKEQVITFNNLNEYVDGNSIRISGTKCVIADISYGTKQEKVAHDQVNAKNLRANLDELNEKRSALEKAKTRLGKQKSFLNQYRSGVVRVSQIDPNISALMSDSNVKSMSEFHKFMEDQVDALVKESLQIDALVSDLDKEIQSTRGNLEKEKPEFTFETNRFAQVIVIAEDSSEIELSLSFTVSNASWKPTYDVRVNSNTKAIEINYYGIITQSTKEDWNNTAISLSTADPTNSAAPPQLARMNIQIEHPAPTYFSPKRQECEDIVMLCEDTKMVKKEKRARRASPSLSKPVRAVETTAETGAISTVFHIPRASSVPSDSSPHKVTITNITFDAKLSYYAVPKLDTNAYLKAETVNKSAYPFLVGQMNVFVDNSLVSTGNMVACNPNEEFSSFLGSDPGVKITYAAPIRYKETQGIMKQSLKATLDRKITVKNTKTTPVHLVITDQIPKSADEKIKVKCINPDFKDKSELSNLKLKASGNSVVSSKTKIDEQCNIEWEFDVAASQEVELGLSYSVSWPASSYLDIDTM